MRKAPYRDGFLRPTGRVKSTYPALRKDERQANLRILTCPSQWEAGKTGRK